MHYVITIAFPLETTNNGEITQRLEGRKVHQCEDLSGQFEIRSLLL